MQKKLKQRYLQTAGPYPINYDEERQELFDRLIFLIMSTQRNSWASTGFNCAELIDNYKQVYGFTNKQYEALLSLLINIAFGEGLSTETKLLVVKVINSITEYQIKISDDFSISNAELFEMFVNLTEEGVKGSLKNADMGVEEIAKFTIFYSRFGEEHVSEALDVSIQNNQIRYLVLFIASLKKQQTAIKVIEELFSDNNLWDRDSCWFYILSQIIKKFPKIDYSSYYQTTLQEVIRIFTSLIDCESDQLLKKLTGSQPFLQIRSIVKSVAVILCYLMLPETQPQHHFIKSCIQRLFNVISGSLDHVNPPDYLNEYLIFMKAFIKVYLERYRKERQQFELVNEDIIEDYHGSYKNSQLIIDNSMQEFFDGLWPQIISKILFFEDSEECKPSKILAELAMYKPEKYVSHILRSILEITDREDLSIFSLHGVKITLLFLQEYIIYDYRECINDYVECCRNLLIATEKLGISDNLDMVQLVFRSYIYFKQVDLQHVNIQNLVEESIELILNNIDKISLGLEGTQNDQAELYVDLSNIFLPFILRLNKTQLSKFEDRFFYKMTNKIPEHDNAYEMLSIALCFVDKQFPSKIFKKILKQLVSKTKGKSQQKQKDWQFLEPIDERLATSNQSSVKWYTTLLQCIFQYHPDNIVKHWADIEKIVILLLSEWQNQTFGEIALDIIYNVMLCLCRTHLDANQFSKEVNGDYQTIKIQWLTLSKQAKELIDLIFDKYYLKLISYMKDRYCVLLEKSSKNVQVIANFESFEEIKNGKDLIRIRKRNLKLVDEILLPDLFDLEQTNEKKLIFKIMSIQYTLLSALMLKAPFYSNLHCDGDFFMEEKFIHLRSKSCQYLEWLLQLLSNYNLLNEQAFLKLFNYYWRESHDQVFYSATIDATNEKLSPYYYSQLYRRKQLMRCPFLLINEAYLLHMVRMQFMLQINPTAYLNNKNYLETNFILGLNSGYQANLHSYFPAFVDVHQYHRQIMSICRYHLDASNSKGYLGRYLVEEDKAMKERLMGACRNLLISIKRVQNVYSYNCCMQDEFMMNSMIQLVGLFKIFTKKNDKVLIIQILYVLLIFGFEPVFLKDNQNINFSQYCRNKVLGYSQVIMREISSLKDTCLNFTRLSAMFEKLQQQICERLNMNISLRLTRSCSMHGETSLMKQIQRVICLIMKKIEQVSQVMEKDLVIYLLMLLLYSNSIAIDSPILGSIISTLFKLCQSSKTEVFDMSKAGLFHIINRFNYHRRITKKVLNSPVKRDLDQFLILRMIGGEGIDYQKIKCNKRQQYFYPEKQIVEYDYNQLASDTSASSYQNQKLLLKYLCDQTILKELFKNFSKDNQLKQTDTVNEGINEQDFKSISNNGHKLMHFVWDYNPTKAQLFMTFLENYTIYPINYYSRIFRKIFRLGGQECQNLIRKIALQMRAGEDEESKLSLYIFSELFLADTKNPQNQEFIEYLIDCSKQNFQFSITCLYSVFCSNFISAQKIYNQIIAKFKNLKGASRLRHLEILTTYMLAQGRFARRAAEVSIGEMLKGINEGADQYSQVIVTMITQCFVIAINLKSISEWVKEPLSTLLQSGKLYKLNQGVGYEEESILVRLLDELVVRSKQQDEIESNKLKIHSQIIKKILASISIYRFNDFFYNLLYKLIDFVVQKHAEEDDTSDEVVISQLRDSQYPEQIYAKLCDRLIELKDRTVFVVRKKLRYLEGLVINRSFRLNKVDIPPFMKLNEKFITYDFVLTLSNIARFMTRQELSKQISTLIKKQVKQKWEIYSLLAFLISFGVSESEEKQKILRQLLKWKKDKLVKEGISEWWKGKNPQTEQQRRLAEMVKNFENPYSYFA